MNRSQWCGALIISVTLHSSLLISIEDQPNQGYGITNALGEKGLEVGLGNIGAYKDQLQQLAAVEKKSNKAPSEPVKATSPINTTQKSEPKQAPTPKPVVEITVAETQPELAEKSVAIATASATATQKQPAQQQHQQERELEREIQPTTDKVADQQQKSQPLMKKGSGEHRDHAGGKKGNGKNYTRELMAWLNQHKVYPTDLKKAKKQGTVVVRFTIEKNGQLTDTGIQKGSGISRLDQAALDMLAKANPVPAIPDALNKQRLVIALPVRYSLETK